jgi:FAD:protein FMN transferase
VSERERRFRRFGTDVRLLAAARDPFEAVRVDAAFARIEELMLEMHRRLTRFDADSELSRLNADPRAEVPVSPLLATAVGAALRAAERSGGLADPTLLGAVEAAGYRRSREGAATPSPRVALAAAPPRRSATAAGAWRDIEVVGGAVRRPPGVRLDLGGSAKGLAADLAAEELRSFGSFAVAVGGEVVLGGAPRAVLVEDPFGGGPVAVLELDNCAVATSGIGRRLWSDGARHAHHLIDPASGAPAWTGVVQATAVGADGVEAEALAKAALLSGPWRGAQVLERGGVLVLDDGEVVRA